MKKNNQKFYENETHSLQKHYAFNLDTLIERLGEDYKAVHKRTSGHNREWIFLNRNEEGTTYLLENGTMEIIKNDKVIRAFMVFKKMINDHQLSDINYSALLQSTPISSHDDREHFIDALIKDIKEQ